MIERLKSSLFSCTRVLSHSSKSMNYSIFCHIIVKSSLQIDYFYISHSLFIILLKDDINPLAYTSQAKSNKICIDEIFLKIDFHILSYQENDIYMKSESTLMAKRESKTKTNPSYSLLEFSLIITRNISISKKCLLFYIFSFSDMNNDHMKSSFYIIIISI